ncbi:MAG: hypothetical protein LBL75_00135 [Rickettsiales bacterium]|jgi:hypothetical protein|nr:hypothetical protein [Rickettsiales bacterium]
MAKEIKIKLPTNLDWKWAAIAILFLMNVCTIYWAYNLSSRANVHEQYIVKTIKSMDNLGQYVLRYHPVKK